MLNFDAFRNKQMTLAELTAPLSLNDLRDLTNEMINRMEALLDSGGEADAAFQPVDLTAHDRFASKAEDLALPWTLGHIIAHTTATAEETAAVAAELARGVLYHGRSRFEVPWQTMTTLSVCRQRLAESRRMRLASLEMWPNEPHLDNRAEVIPGWPPLNAMDCFAVGLMHDDSHLTQMAEVLRQAGAAHPAQ